MKHELNNEQKKAIQTTDCSLLIVAGAGTGKTKVLVEKILHLLQNGIGGGNIIALTFTNKAADEMRERVQEGAGSGTLPFIGTFHSFCASLLREFYKEADIPPRFTIFDRAASKSVLKRCMKQEGISDYTPGAIQNALSRLKTGLAAEGDSDAIDVAARLLPMYTHAMKEESALDFDDLIITAAMLLQKNRNTREQVQSRYTYILIDEFQDTDTLQNTLIALIKHPQAHIIAVGDTDQTIYSWRGASVHNMLGFTEQYTPATVTFLTKNYRSSGNILTAANAVIAKNVFRQKKDLIPTRRDGHPITCIATDDEEHEAERIAQTIKHLCENDVAYRDIAVLFRANFQARALERGMMTNRIPYTVLGARFFERAEIKDLLAYLTLTQNPNSREAFTRAAGVPKRGIGARTLEKVFTKKEHLLQRKAAEKIAALRRDIARITHIAEQHPVAQVLRELITILDYKNHLAKTFDNPDERMYEVRELISFANRFSNLSGRDGIAQLLAEVALSSDQDTLRTDTKNTVRLMTVHAAKGLEFPYVFIAGMEEGLFPFLHNEEAARDHEEERRLCYVAMTRTKERLYCSFARRRGIFGSYQHMKPSSFLSDVPEHLITMTGKNSTPKKAEPPGSVNDTEEGEICITW